MQGIKDIEKPTLTISTDTKTKEKALKRVVARQKLDVFNSVYGSGTGAWLRCRSNGTLRTNRQRRKWAIPPEKSCGRSKGSKLFSLEAEPKAALPHPFSFHGSYDEPRQHQAGAKHSRRGTSFGDLSPLKKNR